MEGLVQHFLVALLLLAHICPVAPQPSNSNKYHRKLAVVPNLSQQSKEEANYLRFHKCRDVMEAYSASYLITREHLEYQFTGLNLSWVNCEMGSFIMMNQRADPNRNVNGTVIQTLDVLDFSVIHLSWFERLQKRHRIKSARGVDPIQPIINSAGILKERALQHPPYSHNALRTVAIMPFLGSDNGAGHSSLGNRLHYLHACFWSIYHETPNIVAMVKFAKDEDFARNMSGLKFYDVVLLNHLPKSASLPVATVQEAKARLLDGRWDFDYIFFTESDQILMMRIHDDIYGHLNAYPRRLIVPHRLLPYPPQILTDIYSRNLTVSSTGWNETSCCLERQNCRDRKTWVSVRNVTAPLLPLFSLQVALGNVNFHEERLRPCVLGPRLGPSEVCP